MGRFHLIEFSDAAFCRGPFYNRDGASAAFNAEMIRTWPVVGVETVNYYSGK